MNSRSLGAGQCGQRTRTLWPGLVLAVLLSGAAQASDMGEARGILRAEHEAILSSRLSARVLEVPFKEGDHFDANEVLVGFDCAGLDAELRATEAKAAAESRNAAMQNELLQMGATGQADADIARFKVREQRARVAAIQEQRKDCQIKAPFAGRVVEPMVRPNETPEANAPLIQVVSDGALELHMVVPSCWLSWMTRGSAFGFEVDETGDRLDAEVSRISAAVDPVSQTVKVISRVDKAPARVLPGMSGTATWLSSGDGEGRRCGVTSS